MSSSMPIRPGWSAVAARSGSGFDDSEAMLLSSTSALPMKRKRVDSPEVEAARAEARSRNPAVLTGPNLTHRDSALSGILSLTVLKNFDIVNVQPTGKGLALDWNCRCCHTTLSQSVGVTSNLPKHFKKCKYLDAPKTPDWRPWFSPGATRDERTVSTSTYDAGRLQQRDAYLLWAISSLHPLYGPPLPFWPTNEPEVICTPTAEELARIYGGLSDSLSNELRSLRSKFSLVMEVRDNGDVEQQLLCLHASWINSAFTLSNACLAVCSLPPEATSEHQAIHIAEILIHNRLVYAWSGVVLCGRPIEPDSLCSALRIEMEEHVDVDLQLEIYGPWGITVAPCLFAEFERLLHDGGLDALVQLCDRFVRRPFEDGVYRGMSSFWNEDDPRTDSETAASQHSQERSVSQGQYGRREGFADMVADDCPAGFFKIRKHRPGLLADVWDMSAALHVPLISQQSTGGFLARMDTMMADIRGGRASMGDAFFFIILLDSYISPVHENADPEDDTTLNTSPSLFASPLRRLKETLTENELVTAAALLRAPAPDAMPLTGARMRNADTLLYKLTSTLVDSYGTHPGQSGYQSGVPLSEHDPTLDPGAPTTSREEVANYLSGRFSWQEHHIRDSTISAIDWWAGHSKSLPRLAILARTLLAIPGDSFHIVNPTYVIAAQCSRPGFPRQNGPKDHLTAAHSLLLHGVTMSRDLLGPKGWWSLTTIISSAKKSSLTERACKLSVQYMLNVQMNIASRP